MTVPTPPAVSEAMREAVARDDAREKLISGIVTRYVADCTLVHRTLTQEDIWLLEGLAFGPLASEIARLTGDLKAAEDQNEALYVKLASLAPHGSCACSYDKPDDVCSHHSPALAAAEAALSRLQADRDAEVGKLRAALGDLRTVADDLAQLNIREGDNKAAGALQYVSGFISDRFAEMEKADG